MEREEISPAHEGIADFELISAEEIVEVVLELAGSDPSRLFNASDRPRTAGVSSRYVRRGEEARFQAISRPFAGR